MEYRKPKSHGRMAQLVEHIVHIDGVTGSSPVATTKIPRLNSLGIILHTRGDTVGKNNTTKWLWAVLLFCTIFMFAGCDEQTVQDDFSGFPKVSLVYYSTALRSEAGNFTTIARIPHAEVVPVVAITEAKGEIWYEVVYRGEHGFLPQDMVEVVDLGDGSLVLPEYDEYAYAGEKADENQIAESSEYIESFKGDWYCSRSNSCNDMEIYLSIFISDGRLHFKRNMISTGAGGSNIEFATAIPTAFTVSSSYTHARYTVKNDTLIEDFSGKKNTYVRSGKTAPTTNVTTINSKTKVPVKKVNTVKALTKEEADALRGTGYHNTRPNSSAENTELAAAMVKCKNCGMHSDNGANSLCDECQYNKAHGLD